MSPKRRLPLTSSQQATVEEVIPKIEDALKKLLSCIPEDKKSKTFCIKL